MQFLPATTTDYAAAAAPFMGGQAQDAYNRTQSGASFDEVYSSFIEEGREKYTGLPQGFDAHVAENGTVDREETDRLERALKRRGAQEASLDALNQLVASGGPMTVGRIFGALSGGSRLSAELEGQDRINFKQVMGKLGFTGDESEEMLSLSDKGAGAAMWRKINEKIGSLDQLELHGDELKSLLQGLDLSDGVKAQIQKLLAEGQSRTFSGEQMQTLLAEAGRELAAKDMASATVRKQMRAAMEEALNEAKLSKKADPSADAKGTVFSDASETLMQQSIEKNIMAGFGTGRDGDHKDGSHRDDPSFVKDGMGRAERIMSKGSPESEAAAHTKSKGEEALNRLMQRIDATAQPQVPLQMDGNTQQTSLAQLAGRHRQEIFSQVEQGMLSNLAGGGSRLTLQLNPQELGQINVMLSVHQGEVRAVIRAENPESAAVLSEQMQQLKTSLEEAGLKVAELDVQTGLREDFTAQQWNGAEQHNQMQDAEERARERRLSGLRREAGRENEAGHTEIATRTGSNGLHIVA